MTARVFLAALRHRPRWRLAVAALLLVCGGAQRVGADDVLRIGSKRFTESYILGAILTQSAAPFARVEYRPGLGNTAVVFEALKAGAIDLYPEYLGTIEREILKAPDAGEATRSAVCSRPRWRRSTARWRRSAWAPRSRSASTMAMRWRCATNRKPPPSAASRNWRSSRQIRLGLSHEFLGRADGWPGLARRYRLPQQPVGLDHGLAYEALAAGQVDAIDIYSTDAKIGRYHLRVLDDDLGYFPRYDALLLYRLDVATRFPQAWQALQRLQGRISAADMIAMNAAAELDGQSFAAIAAAFSRARRGASARLRRHRPRATACGTSCSPPTSAA